MLNIPNLPNARAIAYIAPPGGKGTIQRTGLLGQFAPAYCACAAGIPAIAAPVANESSSCFMMAMIVLMGNVANKIC
jgi:hypothetical protein